MEKIEALIQEMTVPEKVALVEGYHSWMTNAIPRLNIPSIYLTDGPLGVRKKADELGDGATALGQSYPATVFPSSTNLSQTWDDELISNVAKAIGQECQHYDVQVLLAPGMNIKRDPRCGRNFEYFSEDPLLTGRMASAYVQGLQSTGTAATPKHFAFNNAENYRYMSDSIVDERAAREIYLKPFEMCVKQSHPRAIMCSYNKFHSVHCSENPWLLTDVLRNEWGFDGLVMSDWGATRDRVKGIQAGMDLDMPGGIWENRKAIIQSIEDGTLDINDLNKAVRNVLTLIQQSQCNTTLTTEVNLFEESEEVALKTATDSAVLLQNDGSLPLAKDEKIFVVGDLFEKMRYQGAGSSQLNPKTLITPKIAFDRAEICYTYARGYDANKSGIQRDLEEEVFHQLNDVDTVIFFGGLTELFESEGFDRPNLLLPKNQISLLEQLSSMHKRVILVLFGGSCFEIPNVSKYNSILYMGLPGEMGGEASYRLLFGLENPSGKLSQTWVNHVEDIYYNEEYAAHKIELYKESIFVGYRFYDQFPERILFPFGHGLSYTRFSYSNLQVSQEDRRMTITCDVTNDHEVIGAEVVQCYVGKNENSAVYKSNKQLVGYHKVTLQPFETRRIEIVVDKQVLAYYNTVVNQWVIENDVYPIYIGSSSRDIRLTTNIEIDHEDTIASPYTDEINQAYENPDHITNELFQKVIGFDVPSEPRIRPFTLESPLGDYTHSLNGRLIHSGFFRIIARNTRRIEAIKDEQAREAYLKDQQFSVNLFPRISARSMIQSGGGSFQLSAARALTAFANGKIITAFKEFFSKEEILPLPIDEQKEKDTKK